MTYVEILLVRERVGHAPVRKQRFRCKGFRIGSASLLTLDFLRTRSVQHDVVDDDYACILVAAAANVLQDFDAFCVRPVVHDHPKQPYSDVLVLRRLRLKETMTCNDVSSIITQGTNDTYPGMSRGLARGPADGSLARTEDTIRRSSHALPGYIQ